MKSKFAVYTYKTAREDSWSDYHYRGNNPRVAIETWAIEVCKAPTMVAIEVTRKDHACELIDFAYENMEWLSEQCHRPGFPYKEKYILDGVRSKHERRCDDFHEYEGYDGEYYPDQVFPFSLG